MNNLLLTLNEPFWVYGHIVPTKYNVFPAPIMRIDNIPYNLN